MSVHVLRQYFGPDNGQKLLDLVTKSGCELAGHPEPKKKGMILMHMRLAGVNAGGCTKDRVPVEVNPKDFEATRSKINHAIRQALRMGRPAVTP